VHWEGDIMKLNFNENNLLWGLVQKEIGDNYSILDDNKIVSWLYDKKKEGIIIRGFVHENDNHFYFVLNDLDNTFNPDLKHLRVIAGYISANIKVLKQDNLCSHCINPNCELVNTGVMFDCNIHIDTKEN